MGSQDDSRRLPPKWRYPVEKTYTKTSPETMDEFTLVRAHFDEMLLQLQSKETAQYRHDETEAMIHKEGQELCRLMFQASLDRNANNEERHQSVTGEDKVIRPHFRKDCNRTITSMFGEVRYRRMGYSHPKSGSRFPLDQQLNMPKRKYTYGLREQVSLAVCQVAFDASLHNLSNVIAGTIPKRQAEELVAEASIDFDTYYAQRSLTAIQPAETLLVLRQDGKGIVMRHDDLRDATRKAATKEKHTLTTRLSTGEKRNRKRMATVATVYDLKPYQRTTADVISFKQESSNNEADKRQGPKAENKRVWASIEKTMEGVTEDVVQEAMRRDPHRNRSWVMLVDGHKDQIKVIKRVFKRHGVEAPLILDFIHVLEYLWKAAWCFFNSSDKEQAKEAEKWVLTQAKWILHGRSGIAAAGMRNKAHRCKLPDKKSTVIDTVAKYLTNHTEMLRYDYFMERGYPIASGVIEGACRHLISDRFEITGAQWSLKTAEGILKLRAIRSSGDWEQYHAFHKKQEWLRNHHQRFHASETSSWEWRL